MSDIGLAALIIAGAIIFGIIYIGFKIDKLIETVCPHRNMDPHIGEYCRDCGMHVVKHDN